MNTSQTSISDQPIASKDEEALDVFDYSQAMVGFISDCSTPLTIGIQGEWGSGKTSMMNIIRNELAEMEVATAWVNTWEYSMFRQPGEIVPHVMRGLLENLKKGCEERNFWPKKLSGSMEKVASFLQSVGKFALDVGVQKATGKEGFTSAVAGQQQNEALRTEIAEIKREIQHILNEVVDSEENPYKKAVFFIDDLDRIEPAVAVSILEALKNMFDIRHCVFVLAIDYDVVVKGLESKYGPKTDKNEREFRSFFDKIIQVPFSMPISVYNIDRLIQNRFDELGFKVDEKFQLSYKDIASYTVGANPRSIKRLINTYSLLKGIDVIKRDKGRTGTPIGDFVLFALIGMQIAYPRVYQLILKDPDYVHWSSLFAGKNDIAINIPDEYKTEELFDEPWEQIIWSYCQKDTYLKICVSSVLYALNLIRRLAGDEDLDEIVANALLVANITSVDDDQETNQVKFKRVRLDGWEAYAKEQLARGIPAPLLNVLKHVHDSIATAYVASGLITNYTPRDISFNADIAKRRKVFVYAKPQKKLIRLWLAASDGTVDLQKPEDLNEELTDQINQSYEMIVGQ